MHLLWRLFWKLHCQYLFYRVLHLFQWVIFSISVGDFLHPPFWQILVHIRIIGSVDASLRESILCRRARPRGADTSALKTNDSSWWNIIIHRSYTALPPPMKHYHSASEKWPGSHRSPDGIIATGWTHRYSNLTSDVWDKIWSEKILCLAQTFIRENLMFGTNFHQRKSDVWDNLWSDRKLGIFASWSLWWT